VPTSAFQCTELINAYGPSIMTLISEVADPRLVCLEIGVCKWEKQTVQLLGGKKCTWGPGYWCQSVAHAKSCDVSPFLLTAHIMKYCRLIWLSARGCNIKTDL
jgi:saposin